MVHRKHPDGTYHVNGKKYDLLVGSRAQVWHSTAYKTSGGLKRTDLMQNSSGRIVSKKKHNTAKKEKRLEKNGYTTKKGHFGAIKINDSKHKKSEKSKKSKKSRSKHNKSTKNKK